ncbi:sensor histidine kinase [Rhizohabitans arisaemae]|uniref:sensor histidine kinase n=1 Tax=Rhizohabitans arisaemae TaxID=2720610 RepID=UPI0024B0C218|nr:sensor histidine kinase [Rhizohabitans arisaemae]
MGERVWLNRAMHAGFFLLLAASASRLVVRHEMTAQTIVSLSLSALLGLGYAIGVLLWEPLGRKGRLGWLGAVLVCWLILVVLAPSFSWCAVPLFFVCLRLLPQRAAVAASAFLTLAVIVAQIRITDVVEPSLVLAPIAIAAMSVVIFHELRRTGVLEERERLAREIHDTLAQGLSSMGMLLHAAERGWETSPEHARAHVRRARDIAEESLEDARRFIRDLRPSGLDQVPLPDALTALCADVGAAGDLRVRFRREGDPRPLDSAAEAVLFRVAQGALANVCDHAAARRATVTLSYLPDQVTLDIHDDGSGFDPGATTPADGRGYGLRAMRDRLAQVNGRLVIESAPGEGTVLAASLPVESGGHPSEEGR